MKNRKKILVLCMILMVAFLSFVVVNAAETAVFTIHTAKINSDGTITIGVSINSSEQIGGFDLAMRYDGNIVEYVDSGFGDVFSGGIGEIHNNTEQNMVKCVAVYNEGVNGNGEVFHVIFRLKSQESYQPFFEVNGLLDSSAEMNDITYQIQYQQSDGSKASEPDVSGKTADDSIQGQLPQYSAENISEMIPEEIQDDTEDSGVSETDKNNKTNYNKDASENGENVVEIVNQDQEKNFDLEENQLDIQDKVYDQESDVPIDEYVEEKEEVINSKVIIGVLTVTIIIVLGAIWIINKKK